MASNPEPEQAVVHLNSKGTVSQPYAYTYRSVNAPLLEVERGVFWIAAQELIAPVSHPLHGSRQGPIGSPEGRAGEMIHSLLDLPAL